MRAIKWSFRRLLTKLFGRCGQGRPPQESEDDGSATVFGSPLTPPPNFWLHDIDVANPAYNTPPPEPLLFSLSPGPGGGGGIGGGIGGGAAQLGHQLPPYASQLRTMQSAAGQAKHFPGGSGSPVGVCAGAGMYGSPDGDPLLPHHRRTSPPASGGRRPPASGGGGGGGGGWDRGLLSRQAALLPAISSVEGLMATAEFQEHVRSTRRRSAFLERDQSQAKVQLYKDLRRLDPDAFRRLLSRDDIRTYEVRPPSLAFAVADYLVSVLLVPAALGALYWGGAVAAAGSPLLRYGPLCVWLVARLRLAARGHVSLLGRTAGAYLVYDMPDDAAPGNAWEGLAGVGGHLLLTVFEVLMAVLSCGLLAVGSLLSLAVGWRRQTLAMRLLGLRLELESARPTKLSPFSPSSDPTASVLSKASSDQRSLGSLPGRYGLSYR
ncbi:hypothetical protein PLESTB_000852500 [Pleodorina starrii]|uniref:Uncharacterized protein n=1 Tax=Pleodorina starrii TaxID=330485 RepID=A0A9W6BM62_9CHLO|nr:hypothetical protein PLESTM_001440900 [Pleodorina starrii]GLC54335.1 hypothetical protein PLESTB_000852500 [Pleodorina starrii]GLC71985.1 hypothetical protein PLESTF_001192000 [Pleodorina starrii]